MAAAGNKRSEQQPGRRLSAGCVVNNSSLRLPCALLVSRGSAWLLCSGTSGPFPYELPKLLRESGVIGMASPDTTKALVIGPDLGRGTNRPRRHDRTAGDHDPFSAASITASWSRRSQAC